MGLPGSAISFSQVSIALSIHSRRERGEDGRCAVLHVGVYRRAEIFFRTFHEVATTTAVNVQLNTTGHDVASFSVDLLRPFNRQGIVRNG